MIKISKSLITYNHYHLPLPQPITVTITVTITNQLPLMFLLKFWQYKTGKSVLFILCVYIWDDIVCNTMRLKRD